MNCPHEKSLHRQLLRAPSEPTEAALYLGETGWECLARLASGRIVCYHRVRKPIPGRQCRTAGHQWAVKTR